MAFVLLKQAFLTNYEAHFAGGKHVFACMATTLATQKPVHLVFLSTKADVITYAAYHGIIEKLTRGKGPVLSWIGAQPEKLHYHAILTDEAETAGEGLVGAQVNEIRHIVDSYGGSVSVIVDADEALGRSEPGSPEILASLCDSLCGSRVYVLVQNVHFLPFGPSGTSHRTVTLHLAWGKVTGVICVSNFVASYVEKWAKEENVAIHNIRVVPLSAWGAFGEPPFQDLGTAVAERWRNENAPPCVGVLKLTPEKGASIVFQVAKQLPDIKFRAVAGHPQAKQMAAKCANLEIVEPKHNIDEVLQDVGVVLVPSLWLEAFGMVVVEAMLRGIPVVVSDSGALPEAAMGTGVVVPTAQIVLPVDEQTLTPDWSKRVYPKQSVDGWVTAVTGLLANPEEYVLHSLKARARANQFLAQGKQHLHEFLDWINRDLVRISTAITKPSPSEL